MKTRVFLGRSLLSSVLAFVLLLVTGPECEASGTLTWTECLDLALQYNTEIAIAKVGVEEAEGRIIAERSKVLPTIRGGGVTLPPSVIVGLVAPIWSADFAPLAKAIRVGRRAALVNTQLAVLNTTFKLRNLFLEARYAQEQVKVREEEVEILRARFAESPDLVEAGRLSKQSSISQNVQLNLAVDRLLNSKSQARLARLNLCEFIGIDAAHPALRLPIEDDFSAPKLPKTLSALQAHALEQRVDLRLLKDVAALEGLQVDIERARTIPQFAFVSSLRLETETPDFIDPLLDALDPERSPGRVSDDVFSDSRARFDLMMNWRVFDGFDTKGRVITRREVARRREILRDALQREIPRQVATALVTLEYAQTAYDRIKNSDIVERGQEQVRGALDTGMLSYPEFVSARQEGVRFNDSLVRLRFLRDKAEAALLRATGDLIQVKTEALDH